jgi:hypothetical protein
MAMGRLSRAMLSVLVLGSGLGLAACDPPDTIDKISDMIPNNKKPLPGERKQVFPDGVPGVPQGVPAELVKGYQPPPDVAALQTPTAAATPAEPATKSAEAEPPKPKKKKVASKPKPPGEPTQDQAARPTAAPVNQAAAPWPAAQSAPAAAAWPSPQGQAAVAPWPSSPPPAQRTQ